MHDEAASLLASVMGVLRDFAQAENSSEVYRVGPYVTAGSPSWTPHDWTPDQSGIDKGEGCWRDSAGMPCDREPDPESPTGMCKRHAAEARNG